jgi:hypothetical protein
MPKNAPRFDPTTVANWAEDHPGNQSCGRKSMAGTASTYCDRLSAALLLPGERLMIKAPLPFVIGYGNALHEVWNRHNAAGARFCNQCATLLRRACPKCAHPNAPDAKFCAQCGAVLGLQSAAGADASVSPVARGSVRLGPEPLEDSPTLDGERRPSPRCSPTSKARPS